MTAKNHWVAGETWTACILDNRYLISDTGRMIGPSGKILSLGKNKGGYKYAGTYRSDLCKSKNIYIHQAVGIAFILNPHNKKWINHKDGNKQNNNKENLEWMTPVENIEHAYNVLGVVPPWLQDKSTWKKKDLSVIQLKKDGSVIRVFASMKQASTELNIALSSISQCANGKQLSAGGFYFKLYKPKNDTSAI